MALLDGGVGWALFHWQQACSVFAQRIHCLGLTPAVLMVTKAPAASNRCNSGVVKKSLVDKSGVHILCTLFYFHWRLVRTLLALNTP